MLHPAMPPPMITTRARSFTGARSGLHAGAGGIVPGAERDARGHARAGHVDLVAAGEEALRRLAGTKRDVAQADGAAHRVAVSRRGEHPRQRAVAVDGLLAPRHDLRVGEGEQEQPLADAAAPLLEQRVAAEEA